MTKGSRGSLEWPRFKRFWAGYQVLMTLKQKYKMETEFSCFLPRDFPCSEGQAWLGADTDGRRAENPQQPWAIQKELFLFGSGDIWGPGRARKINCTALAVIELNLAAGPCRQQDTQASKAWEVPTPHSDSFHQVGDAGPGTARKGSDGGCDMACLRHMIVAHLGIQ